MHGRTVASGLVPFAFVVVMVAYISGPGAELLDFGVALPDVTIEKIEFLESEIRAIVRNSGPVPVIIAQADVNDRIQPAAVEPDGSLDRYETALVRIPFEWNIAEPYTIGVTIQDGTRFQKEITAVPALEPSLDRLAFFAVIGTYVGIIPVMIGMLWLPFIRNTSRQRLHFFLALTAGLLFFLALDAAQEAVDIANRDLAPSFNGTLLVATVIVLTFLGLYYTGDRLVKKAGPAAIALLLSIGIGMHNFGEGLAIGAAFGLGSIAFGTFLIVGFAIHNTTEGIAIAAAVSRQRLAIARLAGLGMIAGSPAIFGTWIGGFAYWPLWTVVFLAVGVGAILQVMYVMVRWIRDEQQSLSGAHIISGFAVGITVMYLTDIFV